MNEKKLLLIRADADTRTGTGHVMRCLALAEAWRDDGGEVLFVCAYDAPALEDMIRNEGITILRINHCAGSSEDAEKTTQIAREREANWIIVDGYQFGAEYQKTIKDNGFPLLFIDDYGHAGHYYADIVLNQNTYADMFLYNHYEPYTRFLLGTKYVLIRKEFQELSGRNRTIPQKARKILVTLGGGDPDNITLEVIKVLSAIDSGDLDVIVVIGMADPYFDLIHTTMKNLTNFRLIKNAENMSELMAWADVAVSAGGSTCWELAFLGTPTMTIPFADNQKPVVQALSEQNAVINLGDGHTFNKKEISEKIIEVIKSSDLRTSLSENSRKLVDGEGSSRVCMLITSSPIRIRTIKPSDCVTLWNWVNEPIARKSAFTTKYISLEEHQKWFFQKIIDPNCYIFLGVDVQDRPVGQIRFDVNGDNATVDISVDIHWRGKGFAKMLLNSGIYKLSKISNVKTLNACIKKENTSSIRTFIACQFEFSENKIINNSDVIVLSRKLP